MAFKFNDISIKTKLVLMQVFTCVLVLGIFFAVFVVTDVRSYKLRKARNMIGLAQVTGSNNISSLRFGDSDAANEILTELHNVSPEILAAAIVNRNGEFFAATDKLPEIAHGGCGWQPTRILCSVTENCL